MSLEARGEPLLLLKKMVMSTQIHFKRLQSNVCMTSLLSPNTGDSSSISLPPELFNTLSSDDDVSLAFTTYTDAALFPVAMESRSPTFGIASPVIGANILQGGLEQTTFSNGVTVTIVLQIQSAVSDCLVSFAGYCIYNFSLNMIIFRESKFQVVGSGIPMQQVLSVITDYNEPSVGLEFTSKNMSVHRRQW